MIVNNNNNELIYIKDGKVINVVSLSNRGKEMASHCIINDDEAIMIVQVWNCNKVDTTIAVYGIRTDDDTLYRRAYVEVEIPLMIDGFDTVINDNSHIDINNITFKYGGNTVQTTNSLSVEILRDEDDNINYVDVNVNKDTFGDCSNGIVVLNEENEFTILNLNYASAFGLDVDTASQYWMSNDICWALLTNRGVARLYEIVLDSMKAKEHTSTAQLVQDSTDVVVSPNGDLIIVMDEKVVIEKRTLETKCDGGESC